MLPDVSFGLYSPRRHVRAGNASPGQGGEKDRTQDIEEQRKYMQTKKYVEEVAREKLGLVYPNETIYKADK